MDEGVYLSLEALSYLLFGLFHTKHLPEEHLSLQAEVFYPLFDGLQLLTPLPMVVESLILETIRQVDHQIIELGH